MKTDDLVASLTQTSGAEAAARLIETAQKPMSAGEFNDFLSMQNEFNLAILEYITAMHVKGDVDAKHKSFQDSIKALRAIIDFTAIFPARLLERAGFDSAEGYVKDHIAAKKEAE